MTFFKQLQKLDAQIYPLRLKGQKIESPAVVRALKLGTEVDELRERAADLGSLRYLSV